METRNKGKRSQLWSGVSGTQKRSRTAVRPLPDDVVMEILCRLPATDVLRFRRVCRRWKELISAQHFKEMHLTVKPYSSPMILVRDSFHYTKSDKLILLDRSESPRKRPTIRNVRLDFLPSSFSCQYRSDLSNDGLIVLQNVCPSRSLTSLIIFNPISGDKVTISYTRYEYIFYAMFFNPWVKEHCMLLESRTRESRGVVRFKMLILGSQPRCRDLKQPTSFMRSPKIADAGHESPVVIDDATLYWLLESRYVIRHGASYRVFPSCEELILAFNIQTEVFNLMPHPGPIDDCHHVKHSSMQLLKADGHLSFLHITITAMSVIINFWTLKDSATRHWIKSYSVIVNVDQLKINIGGLRSQHFEVMAIGNGELLLKYSFLAGCRGSYSCRFYACNIGIGTARKIGRTYKNSCMYAHVPSFVSLRNCKSQISIRYDGNLC